MCQLPGITCASVDRCYPVITRQWESEQLVHIPSDEHVAVKKNDALNVDE
jgi:hypothetical protein